MYRLVTRILAVSLMTAGLTVSQTTGAQATLNTLVCTLGTQQSLYTPGLLNEPRTVNYTNSGTLAGCVDLSFSGINSGTFNSTGSGVLGCDSLSAVNFTSLFNWNTGKKSKVTGTSVANVKPNGTTVVTLTGTVVANDPATDQFVGRGFISEKILVSPDPLACLAEPGVTSVGGTVTLAIA